MKRFSLLGLVAAAILCFSTCSEVIVVTDGGWLPDGSLPDSSLPGDGGLPDSSTPDAAFPDGGGMPDGTVEDFGVADAEVDSGEPDSGQEDTGVDSGIPTDGGKDGGAYTRTCQQIYTCMSSCGSDTQCKNDCYYTGSQDGQEKFLALQSCIDTNCAGLTGGPLATCINNNCKSEFNACMGGGSDGGMQDGGPKPDGGPHPDGGPKDVGPGPDAGTLGCMDMFTCLLGCGTTNYACMFQCYQGGTPEAKKAAQDAIACSYNNCKTECGAAADGGWGACQSCASTKCSTEWTACVNS
jgi:hypothetical protein